MSSGLRLVQLALCGACTTAAQVPAECRQRGEHAEWLGLPRELCPECEARIAQAVRLLTTGLEPAAIVAIKDIEAARLRTAPELVRPRRRAARPKSP